VIITIAVMMMAFYTRDLLPSHWGLYFGRMHVPGYLLLAYLFLMIVGGLSGFFVVPMNAMLQHRGHVLMGAGHSIAVQNFNENIGVLVMLAFYALLVFLGVSTDQVIVLFGLFVAGMMLLVMWRHRVNLAAGDLMHLIATERVEPTPNR